MDSPGYHTISLQFITKTGNYLDVNSSGFHTVTVLLLYFIIIFNIFIARDIIMVYTTREKLHVLSNWRRGQTDEGLALSNVMEIPTSVT